MGALVEEFDARSAVVVARNADQVVNVVAIEAERRGRENEVRPPHLQLIGAEHRRLRAINLVLWYELEEVACDVEDAARRAILNRDRHAAFAGDETQVAYRRLSVIPREVP